MVLHPDDHKSIILMVSLRRSQRRLYNHIQFVFIYLKEHCPNTLPKHIHKLAANTN